MAAPVGNQNAKNAKRWQQAIRRALARKYGTVDDGLEQLATKLVNLADNSERWAIEEVGNREDGKPSQVIAGDPDEPVRTISEILIRGVDP
jgi:hypothetical protein